MNIKKKFGITFFSLIFILLSIFEMQEVYATGKEITYNEIKTTMPEIVENDDSEDPEKPKNSKLKSNLAFIQTVGTTYGMQIPVSDLIDTYESDESYIGIDVSKWQGDIDWKAVKDSGVKYVMIRCGFRGYGSNGTIVQDQYFNDNMKGALENGLYVGVYFFSTAITEEEAIQEAEFVLECCKEYDIKYPIVYDFEYFGELFDEETGNPYRTNGLTSEQINKNAEAFLGYIRANSTYKTMLYGSEYYLNTIWNVDSFISENDIWLAHYPSIITGNKTSYNGTYQMWQCTDAGQVPGINTLVDLNFDYKYYQLLEKKDSFLDVTKDMWFYEPVEYCKENEIILGYGETREYFKPNEKITRGMFVTILHRMAGSPTADESLAKNFPDVQDGEYYAEAVKWASSVGIVNGFEDGTFGPNKSILRQDLVIMFKNYVEKILNKDVSIVDDKSLLNFDDYHKIEAYAFESVQWAVENKVITGRDGKYIDPLGTATRAETASIIHKYITNVEDDYTEEPEFSDGEVEEEINSIIYCEE